jgi:hypothetical protein
MSVNKQVSLDGVSAILSEAKKNGWKGAKFYFMIGLPPAAEGDEAGEIADFIDEVSRRTGVRCTVSIGIFIPKPHTPYQRAPQIDAEEARRRCEYLRARLKPLGHKVNTADPMTAVIEGILSRGDERAGALVQEAFAKGCRFDAWSEYIRRDIWAEILEKHGGCVKTWLGSRGAHESLAWNCIDSGVSALYLERQWEQSHSGEITSPCIKKCTKNCGVCGTGKEIVENNIQDDTISHGGHDVRCCENGRFGIPSGRGEKRDSPTHRIVFSWSKEGTAVFHSHLDIVEIFSMALLRADIPVLFTQGFNPLPKIEFVSPLSVGIAGMNEIGAVDTECEFESERFMRTMKEVFPSGIAITAARYFLIPRGEKKHSLSSLFWGSEYTAAGKETLIVKSGGEKKFRESAAERGFSPFDMARTGVFARDAQGMAASFFDVYGGFYH